MLDGIRSLAQDSYSLMRRFGLPEYTQSDEIIAAFLRIPTRPHTGPHATSKLEETSALSETF